MAHSPASASGDQPPAEAGLTIQDLTARLKTKGELTAEEIVMLARLDDAGDAGDGSWDDGSDAGRASWDDDHTVPYDKGGRTCECNLHPLCRRHHQAKQAPGWRLEQPEPGTLIWTLPSGRQYTVTPEPYPV